MRPELPSFKPHVLQARVAKGICTAMHSPPPQPFDRIIDLLIFAGAFLAALAPIILGIEILEWVLLGQWPGWSVEDGLLFVGIERPLARFNAVQFVLDIATDLPLAVGLYLGGLAIFFGALKIEPEGNLTPHRP